MSFIYWIRIGDQDADDVGKHAAQYMPLNNGVVEFKVE